MDGTANNLPGLPPIDLSHHYSRLTKNRNVSNIKDFYKYFTIPGIGNLAGGLPNHNNFPFDTLEATVAVPQRFLPTPNNPVGPPREPPIDLLSHTEISDQSAQFPSRILVPETSKATDALRKIDVKSALQYGTAQGYPPLYYYLRQFTRVNLHPNCPYEGGPEIILTCGATDGFSKSIEALSNVWDEKHDWVGDREGMLVEEFAYMNAIQAARPRGLNIVPVAIDNQGMLADGKGGLEDVLANWDERKGKRPHLIYTVTIGQNPTSGTLGAQRRKDIYAICCKYDVIIIEDDPYWYLQYPSSNGSSPPTPIQPISSGFPFLDSLVQSYLSVDTQGRVVRLDTFSKTVAPGCRLGWITTQPALCERLLRITETSTQQPSGFVQSMIAELVIGPHKPSDGGRGGGKDGSGWQVDGWVRWLEGLRGNYERRMVTMCRILDEGKTLVKSGRRASMTDEWSVIDSVPIYSFNWPLGGMFIWLKLNFETHPLFKKLEPEKLSHALWIHLTTEKYLVLVSPGSIFCPTDAIRKEKGWKYFRLCFAAVDDDELEGMSRRFVAGVRDFWGKKRIEDIDDEAVVRAGEALDESNMRGMWAC